ncbi:MAG: hypothetical protein R3B90_18905 [Planctomycetaceae bacterium]
MLNSPREYQSASWPIWLVVLGVAPLVALGIAELTGFGSGPATLRVILLAETALVMCGVGVLILVDALSPRAGRRNRGDWFGDLSAPEGTLLREVSRHQHAWDSRVDGYLRKAWRGSVAELNEPIVERAAAKQIDPFADEHWAESDDALLRQAVTEDRQDREEERAREHEQARERQRQLERTHERERAIVPPRAAPGRRPPPQGGRH